MISALKNARFFKISAPDFNMVLYKVEMATAQRTRSRAVAGAAAQRGN